MRELKFRTYDFVMQRYDDAPEMYATTDGHLEPSGNKIIEQYTNLKDKNGKEIYEGDIVKFDDIDEEAEVSAPAVVVEEYGAYMARCHDGKLYTTEDGVPVILGLIKNELYQVIGNIHENKELLGKEK